MCGFGYMEDLRLIYRPTMRHAETLNEKLYTPLIDIASKWAHPNTKIITNKIRKDKHILNG